MISSDPATIRMSRTLRKIAWTDSRCAGASASLPIWGLRYYRAISRMSRSSASV